MVIKRKHKSCYDCKHYIAATEKEEFERGETQNIIYNCVNDNIDFRFADKHDWMPEEMARKCEYFSPRIYNTECSVCGNRFKFTQPVWKLWIDGNPLCSEKCYKKAKSDKYNSSSSLKRDKEDIRKEVEELFNENAEEDNTEDNDFDVPF